MTPYLYQKYYDAVNNTKLLAPCTHKHLSDKK